VPILVISPHNSAIRDFYGIYEGTESNSLSEIGILACVNNPIQIQNAFNELDNYQAVDLHQFRDKQIQDIKKNHIGRDF
jgi:uridylate kinase